MPNKNCIRLIKASCNLIVIPWNNNANVYKYYDTPLRDLCWLEVDETRTKNIIIMKRSSEKKTLCFWHTTSSEKSLFENKYFFSRLGNKPVSHFFLILIVTQSILKDLMPTNNIRDVMLSRFMTHKRMSLILFSNICIHHENYQ